jgi:hypothetical protein
MLWRLDPETLERWEGCRSAHRFMGFVNKKMIVFKFVAGKPVIVDTITCSDVSMKNSGGMASVWRSSHSDRVHNLSSVPTEVYPSVFMWHTFHSDVRYQPHKGVYNIRFSMLYRTSHSAYVVKNEGTFYILEQAMFDAEIAHDLI